MKTKELADKEWYIECSDTEQRETVRKILERDGLTYLTDNDDEAGMLFVSLCFSEFWYTSKRDATRAIARHRYPIIPAAQFIADNQ